MATETREGDRFLPAEVTDGCQLSDEGAENQTQVLRYKSNRSSTEPFLQPYTTNFCT